MTNPSARLSVFVLLLLAATTANAHTRSESYSRWQADDDSLTGTITIPLREVMLLYEGTDGSTPPRSLFLDEARNETQVMSADGECPLASAEVLQAASGFVRIELSFDCGRSPQVLRYRALFDAAPAHVHYARLYRDGAEVGENLFTDAADRWPLGEATSGGGRSLFAFFRLGVEHIAGGIDHIAFLLGLLLVAGSVGRAVVAVTGFTFGHSISLAAAVIGYVSAEGRLVEAFIGFTVALVAFEYFVLGRTRLYGPATAALAVAAAAGVVSVGTGALPPRALSAFAGMGVFAACYLLATKAHGPHSGRRGGMLLFVATTCFGLVHGFGFAGFLMETGLLGTELLVPLLGFNLGVEAGQLVLVAIAVAGGTLVGRRLPHRVPDAVAALLCGVGLFWFVSRTLA